MTRQRIPAASLVVLAVILGLLATSTPGYAGDTALHPPFDEAWTTESCVQPGHMIRRGVPGSSCSAEATADRNTGAISAATHVSGSGSWVVPGITTSPHAKAVGTVVAAHSLSSAATLAVVRIEDIAVNRTATDTAVSHGSVVGGGYAETSAAVDIRWFDGESYREAAYHFSVDGDASQLALEIPLSNVPVGSRIGFAVTLYAQAAVNYSETVGTGEASASITGTVTSIEIVR